jgi:hypothetical protein
LPETAVILALERKRNWNGFERLKEGGINHYREPALLRKPTASRLH